MGGGGGGGGGGGVFPTVQFNECMEGVVQIHILSIYFNNAPNSDLLFCFVTCFC